MREREAREAMEREEALLLKRKRQQEADRQRREAMARQYKQEEERRQKDQGDGGRLSRSTSNDGHRLSAASQSVVEDEKDDSVSGLRPADGRF